MKSIIILIIMVIAIITSNSDAFAISGATSYAMSVTNISDSCEHGEKITIIDHNKDGLYDLAYREFCDGTFVKDTLIVIGFGNLSHGLTCEMIEGKLTDNNFKLKVFGIFSHDTIACIYRQADIMYLDYTMVTNVSSDGFQSNIKYHFSQNILKIFHPEIIIQDIQIADLKGKEVDRNSYSIVNSAHDTSINFPENIASGSYFVVLFFNKQSYTIKLQI